jgi:polar amino acid transport system substrate-binding protein
MKREKIALILIVGIALSATSFSGCVQQEGKKTIKVGTSADFAPFEYTDENGTIVGFDIELITKILENLNYTVQVQDISFSSLIPSLQAGTIDVIAAAMTITDERDEVIDFTNPYYEANQSILTLSTTDLNLTSDDQVKNLTITIGAQTGTTGAGWAEDNMPNATLQKYDLYVDAVLDLVNGNVDAIILDEPVAKVFAEDGNKHVEYVIVTGENYGFGVREDETELRQQINTELASFMSSEDWTTLINKYFE